jgi:hypothetical protein
VPFNFSLHYRHLSLIFPFDSGESSAIDQSAAYARINGNIETSHKAWNGQDTEASKFGDGYP